MLKTQLRNKNLNVHKIWKRNSIRQVKSLKIFGEGVSHQVWSYKWKWKISHRKVILVINLLSTIKNSVITPNLIFRSYGFQTMWWQMNFRSINSSSKWNFSTWLAFLRWTKFQRYWPLNNSIISKKNKSSSFWAWKFVDINIPKMYLVPKIHCLFKKSVHTYVSGYLQDYAW